MFSHIPKLSYVINNNEDIHKIPNLSGVYSFHGKYKHPLYIGKSININKRIKDHFRDAKIIQKKNNMIKQVTNIEIYDIKSEFYSLLIESFLIKKLKPLYNIQLRKNRELCTLQIKNNKNFKIQLLYLRENDINVSDLSKYYGVFKNKTHAVNQINKIIEKNNLCKVTVGTEKKIKNRSCFAYQLKKCNGACINDELVQEHNSSFIKFLKRLKLKKWPYDGEIKINDGHNVHIINNWVYKGITKDHYKKNTSDFFFDFDSYMIIKKFLLKKPINKKIKVITL